MLIFVDQLKVMTTFSLSTYFPLHLSTCFKNKMKYVPHLRPCRIDFALSVMSEKSGARLTRDDLSVVLGLQA